MEARTVAPMQYSPSERLLREMLLLSTSEAHPISDVIVIWTDNAGVRHVRAADVPSDGATKHGN